MASHSAPDPIVIQLREERIRAGLTLQQLAERLVLASHAHLSTLENGHRSPSLNKIRTITDALGLDIMLVPKRVPPIQNAD